MKVLSEVLIYVLERYAADLRKWCVGAVTGA
jgi:hypothetical protein